MCPYVKSGIFNMKSDLECHFIKSVSERNGDDDKYKYQ